MAIQINEYIGEGNIKHVNEEKTTVKKPSNGAKNKSKLKTNKAAMKKAGAK